MRYLHPIISIVSHRDSGLLFGVQNPERYLVRVNLIFLRYLLYCLFSPKRFYCDLRLEILTVPLVHFFLFSFCYFQRRYPLFQLKICVLFSGLIIPHDNSRCRIENATTLLCRTRSYPRYLKVTVFWSETNGGKLTLTKNIC